ncbi:LysE family translocator [Salinisphaera hydrothermalis]|uniref:LysE family translocator n=1 Tax=Salinisphaera hydrothermalis TaxID=563188 RepID=UPI0033417683
MYTPGPVNLIGLNSGLRSRLLSSLPFFTGVGLAMFAWFTILGLAGQALVPELIVPYLALAGGLYTIYLATQIIRSDITDGDLHTSEEKPLTFASGFLIQFLNPKGMLVVVPISAVMFPAAHIVGVELITAAAGIAIGAGLAPALYCLIGNLVGARVQSAKFFKAANLTLGALLAVVGVAILYEYFWLKVI